MENKVKIISDRLDRQINRSIERNKDRSIRSLDSTQKVGQAFFLFLITYPLAFSMGTRNLEVYF